MSDVQISPLAKRLAEENSIDWRKIRGTGPEGRVIERDILTYLARIMSGEADLPAEPDKSEPVGPAGMPAAVPANVANFAAASAGLAKEGVDLTALIGGIPSNNNLEAMPPLDFGSLEPTPASLEPTPASVVPTPASVVPTPVLSAIETPTVPVVLTPPEAIPPTPFAPRTEAETGLSIIKPPVSVNPTSAEPVFEIDLDDLSDEADELVFENPTIMDTPLSIPEPISPVVAQTAIPVAEPVWTAPEPVWTAPAPVLTEPVLPSDPVWTAPSEPVWTAPRTVTTNVPESVVPNAPELAVPNVPESAVPINPPPVVSSIQEAPFSIQVNEAPVWTAPESVSAPQPAWTFPTSQPETPPAWTSPEPVFVAPPVIEPAIPEAVFVAPPMEVPVTLPVVEPVVLPEVEPVVELVGLNREPEISTPSLEPILEPTHLTVPAMLEEAQQPLNRTIAAAQVSNSISVVAVNSPATVLDTLTANVVQTPTSAEDVIATGVSAPPKPSASVVSPTYTPPNSGVVSDYFQLFVARRELNTKPLEEIRAQLSVSLNNREISNELFLARAVGRAIHLLEIEQFHLARLETSGLQAYTVNGIQHSFLEALQGIARAVPSSAHGLLVVDASQLGVDDLVLPSAFGVLALGRGGKLTLSGNLPPLQSSEFLQKLAELLENPVGLLV